MRPPSTGSGPASADGLRAGLPSFSRSNARRGLIQVPRSGFRPSRRRCTPSATCTTPRSMPRRTATAAPSNSLRSPARHTTAPSRSRCPPSLGRQTCRRVLQASHRPVNRAAPPTDIRAWACSHGNPSELCTSTVSPTRSTRVSVISIHARRASSTKRSRNLRVTSVSFTPPAS